MDMDDAVRKLFFSRSPEESLNDLAEAIKDLKSQIERLRNENANLKNEACKDGELSKLKEERDKALEDYYRGFPITEKEKDAINKWKNKHEEEIHGLTTLEEKIYYGGVSGGTYSYIFIPTTLGTIGKIRCACGMEFVFQDLM